MKRLILGFMFCTIAGLIISCNLNKQQTPSTSRMTIASKKVDCTGVGPMKCLLTKEDGQKNWQYFYDEIKNFNYEEGYEYVIEVKKDSFANPPADASSWKYSLVKQISKVKKESSDLPK